jgi:hypothetical protein
VWEWSRWERIDQQEREYSLLKGIAPQITPGFFC